MENSIAIYPRIIIDDCVVNDLPLFDDEDKEKFDSLTKIQVDFNGMYFLDYLRVSTDMESIVSIANKICNNKIIEANQCSQKHKTKLLQKFNWLKNYIADTCVRDNIKLCD